MKSHRHYRSAQCTFQLSLNERTRVSKSVSNDVMFLNQSSQPPEQTADWNQQPWTQDLRSSSVPGLVALRTCLRGSRWKLRSVRGDRPRCKSWRISAAPEHPGGSPATRRDNTNPPSEELSQHLLSCLARQHLWRALREGGSAITQLCNCPKTLYIENMLLLIWPAKMM